MPGPGPFRPVNRLNKPADFQALFSNGKRTGNRYFLFIARPNDLRVARLGLAVSKKNFPLAVRRNKLKRMVRESFRQHKKELAGLDVVVLVKKQINEIDDREIGPILDKHWKHIKQ